MKRKTVYYYHIVKTNVGVLKDKSSSSRILEDNFEVLGLGLESRVLGLAS